MKTILGGILSVRLALQAFGGLAVVLTSSFAASSPGVAADGPKTHNLFMGVDFSVQYKNQFYRVNDVEGGSFVISVDGKDVKVPTEWGAVKIRVDRSLKLTAALVNVDHLKADRAYTPSHDPVKIYMKQQGEVMAAEDAVASREAFYAQAQVIGNAEGHTGTVNGEHGMAPIYGDPAAAERGVAAASANALSSFSRDNGMIGTMQDELAKKLFDALDVEFTISSDKPLAHPYVVLMANYHAKDAEPGEISNWLYATVLDPVGSKSRRIHIRQGGFPPGYELESYQVHLYDGGQELATTVSDKRVPLTNAESFAYLLLDYLASHKGATLPATPVMGKPSPEQVAQLSADQLNRKYYVRVSKDGIPGAAFADSGLSDPVSGAVAALVGNVRCYPALEKGQPVDGVAELKFSRLAL